MRPVHTTDDGPKAGGSVPEFPPSDVAALLIEHDEIDRLCGLLEAIADTLPHPSDQDCRTAVQLLDVLIPAHMAREAGILSRRLSDPALRDRIAEQHHQDLGLAQELSLALEGPAAGTSPDSPDMLGYMLRCFFNGQRRSMLVEELALRASFTPLPQAPSADRAEGS